MLHEQPLDIDGWASYGGSVDNAIQWYWQATHRNSLSNI